MTGWGLWLCEVAGIRASTVSNLSKQGEHRGDGSETSIRYLLCYLRTSCWTPSPPTTVRDYVRPVAPCPRGRQPSVFLTAAGVISSSGSSKMSRWVPGRSKTQVRQACTGTPTVRHVAMSEQHARAVRALGAAGEEGSVAAWRGTSDPAGHQGTGPCTRSPTCLRGALSAPTLPCRSSPSGWGTDIQLPVKTYGRFAEEDGAQWRSSSARLPARVSAHRRPVARQRREAVRRWSRSRPECSHFGTV